MIKVYAIEFHDCSLDEAASRLQDELELAHKKYPGASVQVIGPMHLNYSLPDPDSTHRDFHYTENGVLIYVNEPEEPDARA